MTKINDPLVSICCITYNHENYIRDAIEGFLMQKTDFPFEIIIHDDASTDATADIIREYEREYPDIIKPIYQTENQYSKGKRATLFTFRAARGKYIALCEGDDYWVDPLKLQKQITEMEKHPDCYISFHPAIKRWVDGSRGDSLLGFYSDKITVVPVEEVILSWDIFMPTASIILNRSVVSRIASFFDLAKEAPVGDYYIRVLGAENGGALYLNDIMSVYRYMIPGSFSERRRDSDSSGDDLWYRRCISAQARLNTFIGNKYSELFDIRRKRYYSEVVRSLRLDVNTKKEIIGEDIDKIDIMDRILWNAVFKHPSIISIIKLPSVMKILRSSRQLVKQILSHSYRWYPGRQGSLEKI
jgi:glycosyltransferase involved in cell wall biosynthesis